MATNKLRVNFLSVKEGSNKLKQESNNLNTNLNNEGNLLTAVKPIIDAGLVSTYFSKYSDFVNKTINYMDSLSNSVMKYHDQLVNIEGYLTDAQLLELENIKKDKNKYVSSNINTTGGVNIDTNSGQEQVNPNEVRIPKDIVLETGYGNLSVYVSSAELNSVIEKIISKYNLTLAQLYSGDYNPTLSDITTQSPNLSVYITTITQMDKIELQNYIKELSMAETHPPLFSNIALFLSFLTKSLNTDFNALVTDPKYAQKLKDSLNEHKNSLITLNDISLKDKTTVQTELNNIINQDGNINKIDPITNEMLKKYLNLVAEENGISLEDLLTKPEYQDLSKRSLQNFLDTILYGKTNEVPLYELANEVKPILDQNGSTIEDVISGKDNNTLTDIIENADSKTSTGIINNMDDKALQDYIGEVVDGKHPTVSEKPVIKEIIKTIVDNKSKITDGETISPLPLDKPLTEEVVDNKPVIIDDEIKETLKNPKYASQVKDAVKNNNSLGWLALLPIAGLGLIPLYGMYKKKKEEDSGDISSYREKDTVVKTIIVDNAFSNYAISNGISEEKLLDGSNFEVLTMYLSGIDNVDYVLNILSKMKDDTLQKYLFDLYNSKYEHIWSKNSTMLRLIFNYLTKTAMKQSLSLEELLNNSNYVVWIKTSIIDLSKTYIKYEEEIKFNGGFVSYINNILNKSTPISDESYNLLKSYLEENSKSKGLNINSYLEQLLDNENRMKIFSIIHFGDGYGKYAFGFLNVIQMMKNNEENPNNIKAQDLLVGIIENSGYLSLLFNSTELQISQTIGKILEKHNVKKEDLFNGKREDVLNVLINKAPNIMVIISILLNFDAIELQKYLNKLQSKEHNKFMLFMFKYLEYLAKSENTTLIVLLSDVQYAELIKTSLTNFKESIMKLYGLSKKEDQILNEEINNIFFMEDPTVFGIDKITISLLKDYFAYSAKKMGVGLNYILDIKNVDLLKKFVNDLVENIIYLSIISKNNSKEEKKNLITDAISLQEAKNNKKDIISKIKQSLNDELNVSLKNKIQKYVNILGKDTNMSFEEYLDSNEFYNFININFENSNIMELVYKYISEGIDYSFDLDEKLSNYAKINNLSVDKIKSIDSTSIIVESIIKENNILYSLETLLNINGDTYENAIKEINLIKENTNLNNTFTYIEEYLKRPRNISIEDYISEKGNLKNIWMLILKLLIIILIILLVSSKEGVK